MKEAQPHPLQKFPGLTTTVTLPLTGIQVLIRRLDVAAFTTDAMRTVLNIPAMREAAQAFATQAAEQLKEPGKQGRPRGELPPEIMLEIQRESERGLLRAALLRPTLDELVGMHGAQGTEPDLGMPDYSFLVNAVDEFSAGKPGDAEKDRARAFPVAASGELAQPGEGVQLPPAPAAED